MRYYFANVKLKQNKMKANRIVYSRLISKGNYENAKNVIFLDGAEKQWIVHWLGIPYLVESSFQGYFYNVLTMDEQSIDLKLEGIILDKFFKMQRNAICQ